MLGEVFLYVYTFDFKSVKRNTKLAKEKKTFSKKPKIRIYIEIETLKCNIESEQPVEYLLQH